MRASAAELREKARALRRLAAPCRLCPNRCGVDRLRGDAGRCGVGREARVAASGAHFGEEAPLVGTRGSGTVFFSGCNLSCLFCQNWRISQELEGQELAAEELVTLFLGLEKSGCHNLNLVSPTHQAHVIVEALAEASARGFDLPVVWNCGGYESVEALRILEGVVDIYMPDLKYGSDDVGRRLSGVAEYVRHSRSAVREMHRQVGELAIDADGVARRGLLVRHLVLPGGLSGTDVVSRFLATELSRDTYVNVMDQYHPCYKAREVPALARPISSEEFRNGMDDARTAGLHRFA